MIVFQLFLHDYQSLMFLEIHSSLKISNSLETLSSQSFLGCSGLRGNLSIGNHVKIIEREAFKDLSELSGSLIIPDSVTSIDDYAFSGCSKLKVLNQSNLESKFIGKCAFPEDFGQKKHNFQLR